MKKLVALAGLLLLLTACADVQIPKRGFMTRALLGPEGAGEASGPPPSSARFCVARGYRPGTLDFERCRYSIDSQKQP